MDNPELILDNNSLDRFSNNSKLKLFSAVNKEPNSKNYQQRMKYVVNEYKDNDIKAVVRSSLDSLPLANKR